MLLEYFNPLEIVNQIVVLIVVCVVVALMIRHWDRVMVAITGDDRLHGTFLDCIYFTFFRCFGTCTGDWTRCFTKTVCCCKKYRGINLVQEVGRLMGISTCTIELKNIVCGDLPWDSRGDFYINVECAANPPMVTSLAEEKLPKVVHFPETITVRVRWSPFEETVRITVKELNLFGSTDLCQVRIPAMSIIDWAYSRGRDNVKRFEMKACNPSIVRETPAWILLEFGRPSDERALDEFHGQVNTIRTATRDGHYTDQSIRDFKHDYTLLDNTGHALQEPLEDDLHSIACRAWLVTAVHYFLICWGCWGLLIFGFVRVYVGSCYRRFRFVTMAMLNNHTFPMSTVELKMLVDACHASFDGTALRPGVPCKPSWPQVYDVCKSDDEGGHFPKKQPHVQAFEGLLVQIGFDTGLPCDRQHCELNHTFQQYDHYLPMALLTYILFVCGFRIAGNACVRAKKYSVQRLRAEQTREFQREMATGTFAGRLLRH